MGWLLDRLQSLIIADISTRVLALEERMATTDQIVTRLNIATSRISARLRRLSDELAGGDEAIAAKFEPLISELEAMGTDPTDPVPEPAPEPIP